MNCSICFETAERPNVTTCGHVFCRDHIHKWLSKEYSCPVCRMKLSHNKGLIEIYHENDSKRVLPGQAEISKPLEDQTDESNAVLGVLGDLRKRWEELLMERTTLRTKNTDLTSENERLKNKVLNQAAEIEKLKMAGTAQQSANTIGRPAPSSANLQYPAVAVALPSAPPPHYLDNSASSSRESKVDVSNLSIPFHDQESSITQPWHQSLNICVHHEPVHGVSIHDTLPLVATASWDHCCNVYDMDTGMEYKLQSTEQRGLYDVEFCPTQVNLLGTVSSDNGCLIWDFDSQRVVGRLREHQGEVNGLSFHPNVDVVATASDDRTVKLWDFEREFCTGTLTGHRNAVYGLSFDQNCLLASASFDWMTLIWDYRTMTVVQALEGHENDIIGVDFDNQGYLLATGSDDGTCRVWDTRTWRTVAILGDQQGEVKRLKFSPHGRGLACSSGENTCKVYDMKTMERVDTLRGHTDYVFDVAWTPDSSRIVTASHDTTWRMWEH